jgi:Uma2 family endonuclease
MMYNDKNSDLDLLIAQEPDASYTYADYLRWTFEERVELIKGKIFKFAAAPARKHQEISGRMFVEMCNQFKNQPCKVYSAPFDVRLPISKGKVASDKIQNVVQPDICIICDHSKLDEKGCIGAPDLIVEILSPSTSQKDLQDKYDLFEEAGVKEYLIVYPDVAIIEQFVLNESGKYVSGGKFFKGEVFHPAQFPSLALDLNIIFEDDF